MGCTNSKEEKPKPAPAAKPAAPAAPAAAAKKEEPAKEAPKEEAPKAEEPKAEAPKEEAPKAETPAPAPAEEPKAEEPKPAAPAQEPSGPAPDGPSMEQKTKLKMEIARLQQQANEACIKAFMEHYKALVKGEDGILAEASIEAVAELPTASGFAKPTNTAELLANTVVLKLNGGLGTGMGLSKAKSLLEVKKDKKFLDLIVAQVAALKKQSPDLSFMLMNSFSTAKDTEEYLANCGTDVGSWNDIHLMQHKVIKINAEDFSPSNHANDELNWCPPGHGDLYAALYGSGKLDELLAKGKKYMFVSNSDNLGATVDEKILGYFARSNKGFLMEVCERTEADKKGGHLAKKGGNLVLREAAQCAAEDVSAFQDVKKHKFFNTNNLWLNLESVKKVMDANGGSMNLPFIKNMKTVDPTDSSSTKVVQLETAMGAAIESFGSDAVAVVVSRDRFSPVKTCNDLLSVRSDVYELDEEAHTITIAASRNGVPPTVSLGPTYKMVAALSTLTNHYDAMPSLIDCKSLTITGDRPVKFSPGVVLTGDVVLNVGDGTETKKVPPGTHTGTLDL